MNDEQLTELLRRLEHEWAPELLRLTAQIIFWDSVREILTGLLFLAACIIASRIFVARWRVTDVDAEIDKDGVGMVAAAVAALFSGLGAFPKLLDIWNWIALFDPQLAVAKRVFDIAIGK